MTELSGAGLLCTINIVWKIASVYSPKNERGVSGPGDKTYVTGNGAPPRKTRLPKSRVGGQSYIWGH